MSGLLEILAKTGDERIEIAALADRLAVSPDDLLAILEAAVSLGFAQTVAGNVALTDTGREFARATILPSKEIFREQLLNCMPIFDAIVKSLEASADGALRADFFLDLWDEYFPAEEAQRQLATAVDWGRYAELFEYDSIEELLYLQEPEPS